MNISNLVTNDSGLVDIEASIAAFRAEVITWKETHEIDPNIIDNAINTIFDRFPKLRVSTPQIISSAVAEISPDPAKYSVLYGQVHSFIKSKIKAGEISAISGAKGGLMRSSEVKSA